MSKVALVIIDLQEDFLPPNGSFAVPHARQLIKPIIKLITEPSFTWSLIIASQDWHPSDHICFASQHNLPPFTETTFKHPYLVKTKKQMVLPDHCVEETFGSSLTVQLRLALEEKPGIPKEIVKKGSLPDRQYLSCFADVWGLHKTNMLEILYSNRITDVVFVGLAYDFCVLESAIDSAKNGLNTYVLKNYCRSLHPEKTNATDKKYKENGVKVIDDYSFMELF
ncbi:PNC1 Nicotinamidase [Candida maltosa Xu316]